MLIVRAFVVSTFVAVMMRFPVTNKFETVKFAKVARPGTYKFANVARGPVKVIFEVTLSVCTFAVVAKRLVVNTFTVVTAFDALIFQVTSKVVFPDTPTMVAVDKFETPYTFRVLVTYTTAESTVK